MGTERRGSYADGGDDRELPEQVVLSIRNWGEGVWPNGETSNIIHCYGLLSRALVSPY